MLELLFWVSVAVVAYTYVGYPLIILVVSKLFRKPVDKRPIFPKVSILLSAYNEEKVIERRLRNFFSLDYPKDKLEIIVVSDGSTDRTAEIVSRWTDMGVKLLNSPTRRGKAHALNRAVAEAKGEIIVFADARQVYDPDAIKELVANFSDERVGAVSGELHFRNGSETSPIGEGLSRYWTYEKFIRKHESMLHSSLGATGAIYAIRRELFTPIPEDTILDDFVIPMKVVQRGFRVIFEPKARAYDRPFSKAKQEFIRKVRTLAGNWQAFAFVKELFNPFRSKVALQLISHKFLRLIVPYLITIAFVSNVLLLPRPFYKLTYILQLLLYTCAMFGLLSQGRKFNPKVCKLCATFVLFNIAVVAGWWNFVRRRQNAIWKKASEC